MPGLRRIPRGRELLESRTQVWRQVGLGAEVDRQRAHRARGRLVLVLVVIAGVLILFQQRQTLLPGYGEEIRIATVAALVILGWALAANLGRSIGPALYRRIEPGTAGTVGFLIRLIAIALVVVIALRIAGVKSSTLAVGGAFTAVVLGLAAQQTIANLFAGLVLLSARPFRVGERVRLVGGMLAGSIEGIVGSLGLFYTTMVSGADRIMVPNSMVLNVAIVPIHEPERVELRARFGAETTPGEVQDRLQDGVSVPMRYPPHIAVEELDRDDVVIRIVATPMRPADGAKLTAEILGAVRQDGGDGARPGQQD